MLIKEMETHSSSFVVSGDLGQQIELANCFPDLTCVGNQELFLQKVGQLKQKRTVRVKFITWGYSQTILTAGSKLSSPGSS